MGCRVTDYTIIIREGNLVSVSPDDFDGGI